MTFDNICFLYMGWIGKNDMNWAVIMSLKCCLIIKKLCISAF